MSNWPGYMLVGQALDTCGLSCIACRFMSKSLEDLNSKVFREQLHTQFKVQTGAQPLHLELIEVVDSNESPKMECFNLYLRGPIKPRLEQKIHRLEHERLGEFEIFLTAISGDAQGTVYESVFHRFRKQP